MVKMFMAMGLVLSACAYDVNYGDCTVRCVADSGCPDGLTCGAEGVCRSADAPACLPPNDGTGGLITHMAGHTIHTFFAGHSDSTFIPPEGLENVELLVVAGGGGGGMTRGGGGGGAGGLEHRSSYTLDQSTYDVIVGIGGGPASRGGDSTFGSITTAGGGAGRPCATPEGGSGGGADHDSNHGTAGEGIASQGNAGGLNGNSNVTIMTFTGAGGGGAGGPGLIGLSMMGGLGGPGLAFKISGLETYYAGGGGGGDQDKGSHNLTSGSGGEGGGGEGGLNSAGQDALDGTGGGGGGGGGGDINDNFYNGGRGGTGVVIVSYESS